jgi:hypothetical protein
MLVLVGDAAAGSETLLLGDEIQVASTHLHCGIFASEGAIGIECYKTTSLRGLAPGTYGVDLTPQHATMFRALSARKTRDVVTRAQPAMRQTFPAAKQRARRLFTAHAGDRAILGGTDIVCAVAAKHGSLVIGCGHVDAAFNTIPGTWGVFLDPKTAAVYRSDKGDQLSSVTLRHQP